jgi:hypothetical protein
MYYTNRAVAFSLFLLALLDFATYRKDHGAKVLHSNRRSPFLRKLSTTS